VSFRE